MDLQTRSAFARNITVKGMLINTLLCAVKFAAGIWGRSSAMVADAVHSLSDSLTDIVVLASLKFSSRPADPEHAYGHGRFETMATLIIALALLAVGGKILYNGIMDIIRLAEGGAIVRPHAIALWTAVISILVKEWLYRYTLKAAKQIGSSALEANAWHHRSDAMSSIGTLLGIGCAYFFGGVWRLADPAAAIIVAGLILFIAGQLAKTGLDELLEKSLPHDEEARILKMITADPAVSSPHNLRTRRIGQNISIEAHIRVEGTMTVADSHRLTEEIERRLRNAYGEGTMVSIHVEPKR